MHTPLCGHALGSPFEYIQNAASRGIGLVTFTCHIPLDPDRFGGPHVRMRADQLPVYFEEIDRAREQTRASGLPVEVLTGIEAEIYPDEDALEEMDATLREYPFDFVLGSLHHQCDGYQDWIIRQDFQSDEAVIEAYFRHIRRGVLSRRYDSIAHPDVIRIYGTVRHFEPACHEKTIRALLAALVETGTCMEVNTSGLIKGVYQVHPDPLILDWAAEAGVHLTMGSDAHTPEQVGQHFGPIRRMLRSKGFRELFVYRQRKPGRVELADGEE